MHKSIERLVKAGKLFRGKLSHKTVHFFPTQELADAFVSARRVPGRIAPVVLTKQSTRASWTRDTPAYYPTNPDGTPAYKFTRAAPAPAVVYRTNTHSPA